MVERGSECKTGPLSETDEECPALGTEKTRRNKGVRPDHPIRRFDMVDMTSMIPLREIEQHATWKVR